MSPADIIGFCNSSVDSISQAPQLDPERQNNRLSMLRRCNLVDYILKFDNDGKESIKSTKFVRDMLLA